MNAPVFLDVAGTALLSADVRRVQHPLAAEEAENSYGINQSPA